MTKNERIEKIWGEIRCLEAHASTAEGSYADYVDERLNSLYDELKQLETASQAKGFHTPYFLPV